MKKIILCLVVLFSVNSYGYSYEKNYDKADRLLSHSSRCEPKELVLEMVVIEINHCMELIIRTHLMIKRDNHYITKEDNNDLINGLRDLRKKYEHFQETGLGFKETAQLAGAQLKKICSYADYVARQHNEVVEKLFAAARAKESRKK